MTTTATLPPATSSDGSASEPAPARTATPVSVALALLDSTIGAQKVRNLRSQVHHEQPDGAGALSELTCLRSELQALLASAKGQCVRLCSTIEVESVEEPLAC